MHYKLHRVAPNSEKWKRPSPGRLQAPGVGRHVADNGFGHEDWNFNFDFSQKGMMLGYTVAQPAQNFAGDEFRLILATFSVDDGWFAVGYYDGAIYMENSVVPANHIIDQMASDVFQIAQINALSIRYNTMTRLQMKATIATEMVHYRWRIPVDKVVVFKEPIAIARKTFAPGTKRMVTSYNITEQQFNDIVAGASAIFFTRPETTLFEEGSRHLRMHNAIERNQKLISAFQRGLQSFACTICAFDFEAEYGNIGIGFIECHHTRPVSEMNPDGDTTSVDELIAVCPNCHRMLHKQKPLVAAAELRIMRRNAKKGRPRHRTRNCDPISLQKT
jgi:hypothetical protein